MPLNTLRMEADAGSPPAAVLTPKALDARAWLVWITGALIVALATFNPWYPMLLIGLVILLWPGDSASAGFLRLGVLLRIGLIALAFGAAFNGLFVRFGVTVVLNLPGGIPLFGGPIYAEAMVYGALNALRFVAILFAFALFSRSVNFADLLRLAPPAFFELGLVMSIGFTLAPSMLRAFTDIRAAQALRGHRLRGVRDLLPLVTPLVISGMERALALAESMESRGYGGGLPDSDSARQVRAAQALTLVSLVGFMIALAVHTFWPVDAFWLVALLTGNTALLIVALRRLSHVSGRTRLDRGRWSWPETVVAGSALLAIAAFLLTDRSILVYDAYRMTALGLPAFNPWLGLALLALAAPGFVGPAPQRMSPAEPARSLAAAPNERRVSSRPGTGD